MEKDLAEKKEEEAAIAVKRKITNLLRHSRRSTRWVLAVLKSILFLSMYLPHTWGGAANFQEYYKTLKELGKNLQDVKGRGKAEARAVFWRRHNNVSWKQCEIVWSGKQIRELAHGVDHEA